MKSLLLILIFSLFCHAVPEDKSVFEELTPKNLNQLDISKPFTKKEARKALGKPALEENGKDFYEADGLKYPLSVSYKEDKSKKLYVHYVKDKPDLKGLLKKLKKENITYEIDNSGKSFVSIKAPAIGVVIKAKHGADEIYSLEKEYD